MRKPAAAESLRCEECGRESEEDERYRAYLTFDGEVAVSVLSAPSASSVSAQRQLSKAPGVTVR